MKWLGIFCIGFFWAGWTYCQQTDLKFVPYTPVEGLSQATVLTIAQDHLGFLWIGTADGLNKYDGTDFQIYRHDADAHGSISSNYVKCILEDSEGILWIATWKGLNRFDRENDRFIRFLPDQEDDGSLSHENISDLAEDRNGTIWLSTIDGMLHRFDKTTEKFKIFPNPVTQSKINDIFIDSGGLIWLAYEDFKLAYFDPHEQSYTLVLKKAPGEVLAFYEDARKWPLGRH